MEVADSPLDLVGNTPMVRLGRVGADVECDLLAELELFGLALVDEAHRGPSVLVLDDGHPVGVLTRRPVPSLLASRAPTRP